MDCPAALRALAKYGDINVRVFFANEETAIEAGFRPCAACLPAKYKIWKTLETDRN
jgi:methylphosphotriester-DNA--protein-cysteine methyltransferase